MTSNLERQIPKQSWQAEAAELILVNNSDMLSSNVCSEKIGSQMDQQTTPAGRARRMPTVAIVW
jgi:hypothetical protein